MRKDREMFRPTWKIEQISKNERNAAYIEAHLCYRYLK